MSTKDLHDLSPSDGLELYLTERADDLREQTIKTLESRVGIFVEWCEEEGTEHLHQLDGMDLHRYRLHIAEGIAKKTLATRLSAVRAFLRWATSVEAVDPELPDKITVPDVSRARSRHLDQETVKSVLDYLQQFRYASRDHAIMVLFIRTGGRLGAIRSLDVEDYDTKEDYLTFRHRPEKGTPLKNGVDGERHVALKSETSLVIGDYIEHERRGTRDDHGRQPLLTTVHGRIAIPTLRRTVYRLTRPCVYGDECPHDRDDGDCEAAESAHDASKCPSSVSPHNLRRTSITHFCRSDVPVPVVSDRCDVSPEVLEHHYNQMSELEKMEQRRGYLDDL